MFHFNKCHCNDVGGVMQRTRDACLDQPVKSGVAEQYKDSITSTSTVHTTEYIEHLIKKAI